MGDQDPDARHQRSARDHFPTLRTLLDDPRATPPAPRGKQDAGSEIFPPRLRIARVPPGHSVLAPSERKFSMLAWLFLTARAWAILRLWSGQRFSRLGLGRLHFFRLSHHAERNSHVVARTPSHKTAGGPVLLQ